LAENTFIKIDFADGKSTTIVSDLTINQSVFNNHFFSLVLPADTLEGKDEPLMTKTKDQIGKPITITYLGNIFKGIIAFLTVSKSNTAQGDIIIKGFGSPILLEDERHCEAYEDKNVSTIVNTIVNKYPKNIIDSTVSVNNNKTYAYLTQYRENSFMFLKRLAATNGEWFFYDGVKLIFGKLPKSKEIPLYFGRDLFSFDLSMRIAPINYELIAHDYNKNEGFKAASSDVHSSVSSSYNSFEYLKTAYNESKNVFSNNSSIKSNDSALDVAELKENIKNSLGVKSSQFVTFSGVSNNPEIKIGSVISVSGKAGSKNENVDSYGKYIVIEVTHTTGGGGNYQNNFKAIPNAIENQPQFTLIELPRCESQTAVVVDNKDPKKLGRIRVKMMWQQNTKTPWIRLMTNHAGNNRGMYFIPEIDDEVILGFENDNPDLPFVLGTVYNGKAHSGDMFSDNNLKKAIRTKSGNSIIFSDENGKEEIKIFSKDEKNIISISLEGSKKITIQSEGDIELTAKNNIKLTAEKDIIFTAKGKNIVEAKQGITMDGTSKIEMKASNIKAEAQANAEIKGGTKVSINSSAQLELKGGAQAELNGGAMTVVKGAVVMVN
jgi:uncharacterized protein involved in type VI secretion and phage assembly